jgi:hypothetical protein
MFEFCKRKSKMDTATVNVIASHKYDTLKAKMQPAKINHISTFKKV